MLRRRSRAKCAGEPAAPLLAVVGALLLPLAPISAQAIGQGFELERAGRYDQAASVYFATLRAEPANVSALLGLERVLPPPFGGPRWPVPPTWRCGGSCSGRTSR